MSRTRLLVVDDDADLLRLMAMHLTRQGYDVEAFSDGNLALQLLGAGEPFAVLVTDLDMPALPGLELLRAARQRDPNLQVIVITGNGTVETAVAAMRADGAYDFIVKPFEALSVLSLAVGRAVTYRDLLLERAALTERLNLLLTNTGDAIFSADAHGVLTVVNPAAVRLLGRDDLIGRVAIESLPRPLPSLLTNWQTLGQAQPTTVEITGPGQAQWMVNMAALPDQGWVVVLRDITLLKRLDDVKFQMLAEAASRLQMPLAQAISNMAELDALLSDKDARAADIVFRQTHVWERIQHWLDDLLAMVRVEAGGRLRATELNLSQVLPDMARLAPERALRDRRVRVKVDVAPDLPLVRLDVELLRQLVYALLGWAAQRSELHGEVRLTAQGHGGQLQLEVTDGGPALEEVDLTRLFGKATGGPESPGLELALVKAVVDRLGGEVWARPQTVGGLIVVYLPLVSAPVGEGYL